LAQQAIGILAAYSLTRALGIMEMDADAQGDGELPMAGEFCSMIPGQRGHHSLRQAPHLRIRAPTTLSLPLPSTFTCITKRELRATKVAIWLFLAPLIRSPSQWPGRVDGNRAILEIGPPIADRDGIDAPPARLACRRRSFAPAHDPADAQMRQKRQKRRLETATRLNEQAFVDRLMQAQSWRDPWDAGRSATRRAAAATIARAAFGRSERTGADWMPAGKAWVGGRNPTPARRRGRRDTPGDRHCGRLRD
jgi:hypothetical protein